MEELLPRLESALQGPVTDEILKKSQEFEDMIYFDDFLGDADVDSNNVTLVTNCGLFIIQLFLSVLR